MGKKCFCKTNHGGDSKNCFSPIFLPNGHALLTLACSCQCVMLPSTQWRTQTLTQRIQMPPMNHGPCGMLASRSSSLIQRMAKTSFKECKNIIGIERRYTVQRELIINELNLIFENRSFWYSWSVGNCDGLMISREMSGMQWDPLIVGNGSTTSCWTPVNT